MLCGYINATSQMFQLAVKLHYFNKLVAYSLLTRDLGPS